ncbi:hypothetical protein [Methylocapsa sp. S129]|uniref:hypothetical protein n=1 Tax=Methylocapsa sp. S129 TaxID=1641869 RepID=UPI00131EAE1C|nr:hypothetical protein [Methylocapsa sp. S129]
MWQTAVLCFFAGLFGANGVPHFVKGITGESYPCALGNSPIPNLIGGWSCFVIAVLLAHWTDVGQYPLISLIAVAIGALLIGLFHAVELAFGRKS